MCRVLTLLLIALVGTGCGWPVSAEPVYGRVQAATLLIEMPDGSCSGTAVSRDWILSATHCFTSNPKTLKVNGELCEVHQTVNDGNDHALVRLGGCPFTATAKLGKPAKVGDRVFMWSSPFKFRHLLLFGTVAGYHPGEIIKARTTLYDLNGYYGSSGGALFNERGEITAVLSIGTRPYHLMGSFPIVFTRKQLRDAGL